MSIFEKIGLKKTPEKILQKKKEKLEIKIKSLEAESVSLNTDMGVIGDKLDKLYLLTGPLKSSDDPDDALEYTRVKEEINKSKIDYTNAEERLKDLPAEIEATQEELEALQAEPDEQEQAQDSDAETTPEKKEKKKFIPGFIAALKSRKEKMTAQMPTKSELGNRLHKMAKMFPVIKKKGLDKKLAAEVKAIKEAKEGHDNKETKESQVELEDRLRKRFPAAWYIYDKTSQDFNLISKESFLDRLKHLDENVDSSYPYMEDSRFVSGSIWNIGMLRSEMGSCYHADTLGVGMILKNAADVTIDGCINTHSEDAVYDIVGRNGVIIAADIKGVKEAEDRYYSEVRDAREEFKKELDAKGVSILIRTPEEQHKKGWQDENDQREREITDWPEKIKNIERENALRKKFPKEFYAFEKISHDVFSKETFLNILEAENYDASTLGSGRSYENLKNSGLGPLFNFHTLGFAMIIKNVDALRHDNGINAKSEDAIYDIVGPDGSVVVSGIKGHEESSNQYWKAVEEYTTKLQAEMSGIDLDAFVKPLSVPEKPETMEPYVPLEPLPIDDKEPLDMEAQMEELLRQTGLQKPQAEKIIRMVNDGSINKPNNRAQTAKATYLKHKDAIDAYIAGTLVPDTPDTEDQEGATSPEDGVQKKKFNLKIFSGLTARLAGLREKSRSKKATSVLEGQLNNGVKDAEDALDKLESEGKGPGDVDYDEAQKVLDTALLAFNDHAVHLLEKSLDESESESEKKGFLGTKLDGYRNWVAGVQEKNPKLASFVKARRGWLKKHPKQARLYMVLGFGVAGGTAALWAGAGAAAVGTAAGMGALSKLGRIGLGMAGGALGGVAGQGLHKGVFSAKYRNKHEDLVENLKLAIESSIDPDEVKAKYEDRIKEARKKIDEKEQKIRRRWAIGAAFAGGFGFASIDAFGGDTSMVIETPQEQLPSVGDSVAELPEGPVLETVEADTVDVEEELVIEEEPFIEEEVIEETPEPVVVEESTPVIEQLPVQDPGAGSLNFDNTERNPGSLNFENTERGGPTATQVMDDGTRVNVATGEVLSDAEVTERIIETSGYNVMRDSDNPIRTLPGASGAAGSIESTYGEMDQLFPGGVHTEIDTLFASEGLAFNKETFEATGLEPIPGGEGENAAVIRNPATDPATEYTWKEFYEQVDLEMVKQNLIKIDAGLEIGEQSFIDPSAATTPVNTGSLNFNNTSAIENTGSGSTSNTGSLNFENTSQGNITSTGSLDFNNTTASEEIQSPSEGSLNFENINPVDTRDGGSLNFEGQANIEKTDDLNIDLSEDVEVENTQPVDVNESQETGDDIDSGSIMENEDLLSGDQITEEGIVADIEKNDNLKNQSGDTVEDIAKVIDNKTDSEAVEVARGINIESANDAGIHIEESEKAVEQPVEETITFENDEDIPEKELEIQPDGYPQTDLTKPQQVENVKDINTIETQPRVNVDSVLESDIIETYNSESFSPEARNLLLEGGQDLFPFPELSPDAPEIYSGVSIIKLEDGSFAFGYSVDNTDMSALQAEESAYNKSTEFLGMMGIDAKPEIPLVDDETGTETTYYTKISESQQDLIIKEYSKYAVQ